MKRKEEKGKESGLNIQHFDQTYQKKGKRQIMRKNRNFPKVGKGLNKAFQAMEARVRDLGN